ncbi:MAG: S8 family peptidase [Velocimicrobium sp.]
MYDTGDNLTPINEKYSIMFIPSGATDICTLGKYPYRFFPSIFTLTSTVDLEKSGIGKVQRNPSLALFGRGILVGIIDTGIDYQHKAFLYSDNTSRIISIWDQTIQDGVVPQGFSYGTEYTREQINIALKSNSPLLIVPSMDENGHGTAIASIAAGSQDLENSFSGVVPEAELVVVKLKEAKNRTRRMFLIPEDAICYQETDIMLGIRYLQNVALKLRRPLILCIAFGTSQGGHDSLGATSSYLGNINQRAQTSVSIAAGNEGNAQRHFFGVVNESTFTSDFELKVSKKDRAFSFEIWCDSLSRVSIEITSPTGETIPEEFPRFNICRKFTFIYESSVVWINNNALEEQTGDQMLLIRMENPLEGIWRFRLHNIENEVSSYHAWLPSGDLISGDTFFLQSNPDTTITSPGNSLNPMTITAYDQINDSILLESGRGYTRSNDIKPDLAAPGVNLTCATINGRYGALTGTGAATAYSCGISAMVLEWAVVRGNYSYITGMDIKRLLTRGAVREEGTVYPNNVWGYGKINIEGLFQKLRL